MNWTVASWIFFGLALPLSVAGANVGWVLLLATLVARSTARREDVGALWRGGLTPLLRPLGLYCAAAALTSACAAEPGLSVALLRKDFHKLWLCGLFAAGLGAVDANAEARILAALAAGFSLAGSFGIGQALGHRLARGGWVRAHAFIHPVAFGEMMAIAVLGAACMLAKAPSSAGADSGGVRGPASRRLGWIFAATAACALLLSQTRAAVLGVAAGLALIGLRVPALRPAFAAGAFLAVTGAAAADLLPSRQMGRSLILNWSRVADTLSQSNFARLTLWNAAWKMFLAHPWLGVGPGNYRTQIARYFSGAVDGEVGVGSAHNLFLHQLAERGIAGFAALAALFGVLWTRSYDRVRDRPDAWNLWAFSATAAFTVMNMTETALQTEQVWMLFFLVWVWAEKRHQRRAAGIA